MAQGGKEGLYAVAAVTGALALTCGISDYNRRHPEQPVRPAGIVRELSEAPRAVATSMSVAATAVAPDGVVSQRARGEIFNLSGGCVLRGDAVKYSDDGKATKLYDEGPGSHNTGSVVVLAIPTYQQIKFAAPFAASTICFTTPEAAQTEGIRASQEMRTREGCLSRCKAVLRHIISPRGTQVEID